MATYDIEMNWLHQHFAPNTKATIILSPSQGDPRSDPSLPGPGIHPIEIFPPWKDCKGWKVCVPRRPKQGFMTMHIKFLLLFFQDHLRLCILTGNLNHFDWERIENSAFIQDFPLRKLEDDDEDPSGGKGKGKGRERSEFKTYLVRVLKSLSLPPDHAAFGYLSRCDFSKAEAKLVASWPEATVLSGWDSIESQGLGRLGKVVRELGIKREKGGVSLEAQGSSLAKYDRKWLEHFHALGSGVDPRGNLPFKTENRSKTSSSEYLRCIGGSVAGVPPTSRRQPPGDLDWPPIKILFPSQSWVERESIEGPNGAGTFFGKTNEFRTSPYKSLFHQPVSKRGAFMIHAKSLLAFQPCASNRILNGGGARVGSHLSGPIRANPPIGWTYLGSANFTRAAHGNITGTLTHPTMSTMNWELGVVLPIYEQDGDDSKPLSAITYKRPCKRYSESDQTWDLNTLE
ncbi:phospholipase D/nuclease [Violaceomyces palustris]|uniref:Phospholipase D/nuclease n=1 Tax=Violaceomyces palustris TaxID=1673888 RepID=A0ACD0P039_9BASI|nr:phospholipase D/nuclease [Violaceomyces palustris]